MSLLEIVDSIVVAASLFIGVAVGRKMRPKSPEPLKPICSCEHGFGSHENGRRCHGKVDEPTHFDRYGAEIAWRKAQCTCLRYDGPDPAIFGLEGSPVSQ